MNRYIHVKKNNNNLSLIFGLLKLAYQVSRLQVEMSDSCTEVRANQPQDGDDSMTSSIDLHRRSSPDSRAPNAKMEKRVLKMPAEKRFVYIEDAIQLVVNN